MACKFVGRAYAYADNRLSNIQDPYYRMECHVAANTTSAEIQVMFRGIIDLRNYFFAFNVESIDKEGILRMKEGQNLIEWEQNALNSMADNEKIHRGFLKAYNSISSEIQQRLNVLLEEHPTYSVVIVGHSFGGAMATLATRFLNFTTDGVPDRNVSMVSIGAPRVGNDVFGERLRERGFNLYRVVNERDGFARIPLQHWGGYRQASDEYWIHDGVIYRCPLGPNATEPLECINKFNTFGLRHNDHDLFLYRKNLWPNEKFKKRKVFGSC
jgi:predicted lipase